ncbi:MAG: hypothetical protein WC089_03350 [Candidatus Paceibacterota bacterium]
MTTKIDLYVTVTDFEAAHLIKGEITFKKGLTIPYSAKKNRTEIVEPILLNTERLNINNHIPTLMLKNIKEGIKRALLSFLEKRNNPCKPEIPKELKDGSFTHKMYQHTDKIEGSKMITFEIEESEVGCLFDKAVPQKITEKVSQKSFASLACN